MGIAVAPATPHPTPRRPRPRSYPMGHHASLPSSVSQYRRRVASELLLAAEIRVSSSISHRTYPLQSAHATGFRLWMQVALRFSSFSLSIKVVNVVGRNVVTVPLDSTGELLSILLSLLSILMYIFLSTLPLSLLKSVFPGSFRRVLARFVYLPMPNSLCAYDLRH